MTAENIMLLSSDLSEAGHPAELINATSDKIRVVFDLKNWFKQYPELRRCPIESFFDVKLAAYVRNPADNAGNLTDLWQVFNPGDAGSGDVSEKDMLLDLYSKLAPEMSENVIFKSVEMPLSAVLCEMEERGIRLDGASLEQFGNTLSGAIAAAEEKIYQLADKKFNINSTKQLSALLFDELHLTPAGKKTKSGYSTDAEALEKMLDQHPVIELILQYRKVSKLYSTYVEGLLKYLGGDGKLHTTFNMTATATGRLSSTEPNLQNLPVRSDMGGEIRKFLQPDAGDVFIGADYSQIELRVLAHMADDPVMIEAFRNHADIHAVTAAQIFNVPQSEVTPEMRRKAKAVNFGIIYGMSAFALANDLNISREEAENYIKSYFEKYAAVKNYLDLAVKNARKNGYVETLFGRRRYLPELKSKVFAVRSFGERVALNMPIQGTAADLIKLAMIKVDSELKKARIKGGLLLQIHDELLISAAAEQADAAAEILKNVMENAAELSVPLEVSLARGGSYYEVK